MRMVRAGARISIFSRREVFIAESCKDVECANKTNKNIVVANKNWWRFIAKHFMQ